MATRIENLLFDLGGVLLHVYYERTKAAFQALGITDFDRHFTQFKASPLFERLEVGQIEPPAFLEALRRETGLWDTPDDALRRAWNAMLGDLPAAHLENLQALGRDYRLFLLSNTNAIHLEAFYGIVAEQHGIDFDAQFEGAHYSHQLGRRKPGAAAFEAVLARHRLSPHRTLFIDDSPPNLEGARQAGLLTLHHPSNQSLEERHLRSCIAASEKGA